MRRGKKIALGIGLGVVVVAAGATVTYHAIGWGIEKTIDNALPNLTHSEPQRYYLEKPQYQTYQTYKHA